MAKKTKSTALTPKDLNTYLLSQTDKIGEWCKSTGLDPQSLRRLAVREAMEPDSKLGECDPMSIFLALCDAAQLGLEPSGLGGEAYLIPFWDKRADPPRYQASLMPGWQGLAKLARQGGVVDIWSYVVREGDDFTVSLGTEPRIEHRPRGTDGDMIAVYAVAEKVAGRPHFEVLWKADIERIRKSSKGADRGPWSHWPDEMARKSAVRRLCKYLPRTRELSAALAADGPAQVGDYNGYRRALDASREPDFEAPKLPPAAPKGARAVKDAIGVKPPPPALPAPDEPTDIAKVIRKSIIEERQTESQKAPRPAPRTTAEPPPTESGAMSQCDACGVPVDPGSSWCDACWEVQQELEKGASEVPQPAGQQSLLPAGPAPSNQKKDEWWGK